MSETDEIVFTQVPSLGGQKVILHRDRMVVIEKVAGVVRERQIRFVDIEIPIKIGARRFLRFTAVQVAFFAIFFASAWRVSGPSHLSDALEAVLGFLALSSLFSIYITVQPIMFARVNSKKGGVLLELYRHRRVALPFDEFLAQLQRRLQSPN